MGAKATTITTAVRLKKKGLKDLKKVDNLDLLSLFTRLSIIELQKNKLSGFPEKILQDLQKSTRVMEFLQELNLSYNRFTKLPEEMYLLINMRVLKLQHNQICELSSGLCSFYRLEELYIDHNNIEYLPWNLHKLKQLKILHIQSNKITYIPNTIAKLADTLKEMLLIPNSLTPVPEDDVIWALHNGYNDVILEFLAKQLIPTDYPCWSDIKKYSVKKNEKLSLYSEDQNILKLLIKHPKVLSSLEKFMQKEYSIENLMFWKVIKQFGRTYNSDVEITTNELVEAAKTIFLSYIAEDSRYTINLPAEIHANLRRIFLDTFVYPKGINQWVFKPAARAILDLISRDTFLRWKSTEEGSQLIKHYQKAKKLEEKYKINLSSM